MEEKKSEQGVDSERKENAPAPTESKTSKKKKKKDKLSKEVKDSEQSNGIDASGLDEGVNNTEPTEEDNSAVDMKERLKKMASMRKKKSNKEMDAAAIEAAARSARLAAAKRKEKIHYNQQPVR